MPGFDNGVVYATNVDFSQASPISGTAQVVSDGQLLIGSTASPNIRVGHITSLDGTITVTQGAGTIDLSGSGFSGSEVSFSAFLNAIQMNVVGAGGGFYKVPFNGISFDTGGNFSTTNNEFTAPSNGNYIFTSCVLIDPTSTLTLPTFLMRFNAPNYTPNVRLDTIQIANNGYYTLENTAIISMTAGDKCSVEIAVSGSATNDVNVFGDPSPTQYYTFFAGAKVGNSGSSGITTINTQVFTSSGTYTPTSGMIYCVVETVGGGGGGGGTNGAGSSTTSTSLGGGGGGGYSRRTLSASTVGASKSVTIGAGGAAGAIPSGTGGTGGTTSFGGILSATGGTGGAGGILVIGINLTAGGSGGSGSGGDFNTTGAPGGYALGITGGTDLGVSGFGGSSFFGGGAVAPQILTTVVPSSIPGNAATSYGGGGSGGCTVSGNGTSVIGGAGFAGLVVITEYI